MTTDHIDEGDVEEHSGGDGEYPVAAIGRLSGDDADDEADVTGARRQPVEEDSLLHRHSRVEQDSEVAWNTRHHCVITASSPRHRGVTS